MGLCQGNFQNLFKMSGISETESKMALAPNSSIEGKKLRDIAGIGPATEKLLLSKNFTKASDVYRQYVLLNKDGEAFSEWLKEDIGMRRKCDIESCLNDIKSWQEPRVRTPQTRRDLENNAQGEEEREHLSYISPASQNRSADSELLSMINSLKKEIAVLNRVLGEKISTLQTEFNEFKEEKDLEIRELRERLNRFENEDN